MTRSACLLLATLLGLAGSLPAPTQAAYRVAVLGSTAVGACQPALPTYDGNIRKRPLAIQNEGSTVAFVTCSFPTDATAGSFFKAFMNLDNSSAAARSVTCTLVQGVSGSSTRPSITKTVVLPANTTQTTMRWEAADNGGVALSPVVSASCSLPEGTAISYVAYQIDVDIGA